MAAPCLAQAASAAVQNKSFTSARIVGEVLSVIEQGAKGACNFACCMPHTAWCVPGGDSPVQATPLSSFVFPRVLSRVLSWVLTCLAFPRVSPESGRRAARELPAPAVHEWLTLSTMANGPLAMVDSPSHS